MQTIHCVIVHNNKIAYFINKEQQKGGERAREIQMRYNAIKRIRTRYCSAHPLNVYIYIIYFEYVFDCVYFFAHTYKEYTRIIYVCVCVCFFSAEFDAIIIAITSERIETVKANAERNTAIGHIPCIYLSIHLSIYMHIICMQKLIRYKLLFTIVQLQ